MILVSGFSGLGVHTILSTLRFFPGLYKQFIFVSIAVVDSGHFKGREEIEALQRQTDEDVQKYVDLTRRLGFPAEGVTDIGTEVVEEATQVCEQIAQEVPEGDDHLRQARLPAGALLQPPAAQRDADADSAPPAMARRADGGAAGSGERMNRDP